MKDDAVPPRKEELAASREWSRYDSLFELNDRALFAWEKSLQLNPDSL